MVVNPLELDPLALQPRVELDHVLSWPDAVVDHEHNVLLVLLQASKHCIFEELEVVLLCVSAGNAQDIALPGLVNYLVVIFLLDDSCSTDTISIIMMEHNDVWILLLHYDCHLSENLISFESKVTQLETGGRMRTWWHKALFTSLAEACSQDQERDLEASAIDAYFSCSAYSSSIVCGQIHDSQEMHIRLEPKHNPRIP